MKKYISIFIVIALLLSLVGCGGKTQNQSVENGDIEVKDLEIKESGWAVNNEYMVYYIVLHNPNEDTAIQYPGYRVTARDSSNAVIDTREHNISIVYPGQDFIYGAQAFKVDGMPDSVDFEVIASEKHNQKKVSTLKSFTPLEVVNTSENVDKKDHNFTGEINNPNDYDIDKAFVVCVCKDSSGNVVMVRETYIDDLKAESKTPFSIKIVGEFEYSSVEYYANQW